MATWAESAAEAPVDGSSVDGSQQARHTRRRAAAVTCGALVVVGALAWGTWWLTHPENFDPVGSGMEAQVPGDGMTSIVVGMSFPDVHGIVDKRLTIRDADVLVAEDSAPVDVRLEVCTVVSTHAGWIGSIDAREVDDWCSRLVPADGATLSLALADRQQLVMTATPTGSGTVRIDGVRLRYRDGLRLGDERTGVEVVLSPE